VEVTKPPKPPVERAALGGSASRQVVTCVNAEQAPKQTDAGADPAHLRGKPLSLVSGERHDPFQRSRRGKGDGMPAQGERRNTGDPSGGCVTQPEAREGQAGPSGESERSIVPRKPGNAGGGKGPQFKVNVRSGDSREIGVSLEPPVKVGKLQAALHAKAKSAPTYRFYALYDKVYRADVLEYAYRCCKVNDGSAGVDGQSFHDIHAYGEAKWLGELAEELRKRTYRPQAVRRVYIPKPDGKQRPLGIPTIKDRVVQMAVLLLLEAIFEADLQPEQYAYRPGRSALDAVQQVQALMIQGHTEVVDADLSGYFDSIPHAELMKSVARRVSDRHVLALIKRWLEMPVEERTERGTKQRTTRNRDEGRGTPQGAPLSPLLANLYMRRFILGWKTLGHESRLDAHIVNYADDFVICCRGSAAEAMTVMRNMMARLRLTVNETKTRLCRGPDEPFNFLGYTIGRCYAPKTGCPYTGVRPADQKIQGLNLKLSAHTERRWTWLDVADMVGRLNYCMRSWANYFCLGTVTAAYRKVTDHACGRLRQWLMRKFPRQRLWWSRTSNYHLHEELGLLRPRRLPIRARARPHETLSESRMR
jgi:RNA-directed DNA polymerase